MLHQSKPLKQANKEHNYSEEAARLLPAPVSAIRIQKKNKTRFSVFIDDEFLIGISDAVLTRFNIYKGSIITHDLLQQLLEAEQMWAAREYMLRLLGRREHSPKELQTKAFKKGFTEEICSHIIDELEKKDYINPERFARKFASDKFEFNKWGPYKIKIELLKKGISEKLADRILKEHFTADEIKSQMVLLISKKKNRFSRETDKNKRSKKMFDFLLRKGFNSSEILAHLEECNRIIQT